MCEDEQLIGEALALRLAVGVGGCGRRRQGRGGEGGRNEEQELGGVGQERGGEMKDMKSWTSEECEELGQYDVFLDNITGNIFNYSREA